MNDKKYSCELCGDLFECKDDVEYDEMWHCCIPCSHKLTNPYTVWEDDE